MSDFTNLRYYVNDPQLVDPKLYGPYSLGDTPTIPGEGATLVEDKPPFYPITEGTRPPGRVTDTRTWRQTELDVLITYTPDPLTPTEAATIKEDELTQHRNSVIFGGVPVQVNGATWAVMSSESIDLSIWAQWAPGLTAPAGGFYVRLRDPYNGKEQLAIQGATKIDAGKQAMLDHNSNALAAWDTGMDEVTAILNDGALSDEQKVADILALDVTSYNWPPNDPPAP